MELFFGLGLLYMLLMVALWWAPVVLIALSDRTRGLEKLAWIGLVVFFSWFSWILYLLIAPLSETSGGSGRRSDGLSRWIERQERRRR